jgi:DNA-binding transcriptional LysR family regulator
MSTPDLNLLITLDVLLAEGSVARAAKRLRLSPSAMSRALARLRETTGDPLLVRAGRGLVPTPRALELRERVAQLVQEAQAVLRPAEQPDLLQVSRTFTLRTSEGFVENFGAALIARVAEQAPGIRLRFMPKTRQGQHGVARRHGRSGNGCGGQDGEPGTAYPGVVPRSIDRRGARGASAVRR